MNRTCGTAIAAVSLGFLVLRGAAREFVNSTAPVFVRVAAHFFTWSNSTVDNYFIGSGTPVMLFFFLHHEVVVTAWLEGYSKHIHNLLGYFF